MATINHVSKTEYAQSTLILWKCRCVLLKLLFRCCCSKHADSIPFYPLGSKFRSKARSLPGMCESPVSLAFVLGKLPSFQRSASHSPGETLVCLGLQFGNTSNSKCWSFGSTSQSNMVHGSLLVSCSIKV